MLVILTTAWYVFRLLCLCACVCMCRVCVCVCARVCMCVLNTIHRAPCLRSRTATIQVCRVVRSRIFSVCIRRIYTYHTYFRIIRNTAWAPVLAKEQNKVRHIINGISYRIRISYTHNPTGMSCVIGLRRIWCVRVFSCVHGTCRCVILGRVLVSRVVRQVSPAAQA